MKKDEWFTMFIFATKRMAILPEQLNEVIRRRRAVFPHQYINKPIPREILEQILKNANYAPTHRLTQPWRFRVFTGAGRQRLSEFLSSWYIRQTPADKYSEIKLKKTRQKPLQSACVIAICMQRDPQERLPEWEELASVACAVQNMWLSCTAYGIGCYWSSPGAIYQAREFLDLKPGEKCLGFFYMGYYEPLKQEAKRDPIQEKTIWVEH